MNKNHKYVVKITLSENADKIYNLEPVRNSLLNRICY